jgi:hypothetical protein
MSNDTVTEYLCKNCIHSHIDLDDRLFGYLFNFGQFSKHYYRCKKTLTKKHFNSNPVTGSERVETHMEWCSVTRTNTEACGSEGKWWTPKHKKDLFKLLKR